MNFMDNIWNAYKYKYWMHTTQILDHAFRKLEPMRFYGDSCRALGEPVNGRTYFDLVFNHSLAIVSL